MKANLQRGVGRIAIVFLLASAVAFVGGITSRMQQEQKNARLISSLKRHDTSNVLLLLAQGAEPNAFDFPADSRSFWQKVLDLVHGSRPSAKASCALILALSYGINDDSPPDNVEEIRALLDHGARMNVRDNYGSTPLMIAGTAGKLKTACLLIDRGADVNATNGGKTVLMQATIWEQEKVCKILLERGAAINAKDLDGRTALMRAINGQHESIAKLLLEQRPDVNIRADYGQTALSIAKRKLPEIVPFLKRAGANE